MSKNCGEAKRFERDLHERKKAVLLRRRNLVCLVSWSHVGLPFLAQVSCWQSEAYRRETA